MRFRSVAVIVLVFGAAALVSVFVVRRIAFHPARQVPATVSAAAPVPEVTPPAEPPATAADGQLELLATSGEAPLAGAEVRLYLALPPGPGTLAPAWRRAGVARTDGTGVARLPARPGSYLVAVRAAGLGTAHAEVVRPRGEDLTHAEVALEQPVSLEVRVASRPEGRPVAARVVAFPAAAGPLRFGPPSAPVEEQVTATADASGVARLAGLAPASYAVAAEAADLHPALLRRVAVPRTGALAIALEPLGRIEGVVHDASGRPSARATVRGASRDHSGEAISDASGRFTLAVPAGSYRLSAVEGERAGGVGPVSVQAGATTGGVELVLGPPAALAGEVVEEGSGRPVPGAEVALSPHETGALAARVLAGADGRYRIPALAPGQYDLRAAAAGRSPALQRGVTLEAGATFPLRVPLAGTGAIEGAVGDARGRPLDGARVRVEARGDG
ncbi:carboxypeptidase-like regulatory domain-containing protein, partial [Anaeromyxobacter sp. SG66]|uniref:carboxypeptidase-like regulatory domain-containing protein n=1 Tax=Anaeromyxobacter sp. SG66 TaxID=2925410 RepID=UPI001F59D240